MKRDDQLFEAIVDILKPPGIAHLNPHHSAVIQQCLDMRKSLIEEFPELDGDEGTLNDTLDGISDGGDLVAYMIRNALLDEAFAEACKKREAEIKARRERLELRAERRREVALKMMEALERTSVKLPDMSISISPGQPKVVITDEASLPERFLRVKYSANLTAIKGALVAGTKVDGAVLSNGQPHIRVVTK